MWSSWAMWEWTQLWEQESFVHATEGGTMQISWEMRSKTENWDLTPMGISISTLITPTLTLNVLKELAQGKWIWLLMWGLLWMVLWEYHPCAQQWLKKSAQERGTPDDIQAYSTKGRVVFWFYWFGFWFCFFPPPHGIYCNRMLQYPKLWLGSQKGLGNILADRSTGFLPNMSV